MKRKLRILISFFVIAYSSQAQDGKILKQTSYIFSDSSIEKLSKAIPGINELIDQVDVYSIVYMSDNLKVTGYMAMPKKQGKYPCVIVNRGGNREFGGWSDGTLLRFFNEVSSWGYVVVGSNYRGNAGGEGKEEFGGSDVNDVLNLIPLLEQVEKADTSRIGMYGWSRGGMQTYLALTKTNRMRAAIIGSGMADAYIQTKYRPEMDTVFAQLVPGYFDNRDSVFRTRGAVYWTNKICKTTPLLLLTGSADWRVPPEEQFKILNQLYELKHPVRFMLFEGGDHSLGDFRAEISHATRNFLNDYVRDKKPLPNMEPHGK